MLVCPFCVTEESLLLAVREGVVVVSVDRGQKPPAINGLSTKPETYRHEK